MFDLKAALHKKNKSKILKEGCQTFQTFQAPLTFTKANMAFNEYCPYRAKLMV